MLIEIINVGQTSTTPDRSGKPYRQFELVFRNTEQNKVETRKITEYSKAAYDALSKAATGQFYEITRTKSADGKFWNWDSAIISTAPAATPAAAPSSGASTGRVTGSNYETPIERAWHRTRSFRGFAIGHAVSILKVDKAVPAWDDVKALAAQIEQWINRSTEENPMQAIVNMEDDIPM